MAKNVIVDSVTKGGTDKAPTAVLSYVGTDGSIWKIGNLLTKLDETTRAKLRTLKKGDTVSIEIKKEGNYWNLISAGDPVAETTKKPTFNSYNKTSQEGRLTDVEKAQGAQRGNVLTNAVNIVIASGGATGNVAQTLDAVKKVALGLLDVSNDLENNTRNESELTLQLQQQDLDDPEVTESLGF